MIKKIIFLACLIYMDFRAMELDVVEENSENGTQEAQSFQVGCGLARSLDRFSDNIENFNYSERNIDAGNTCVMCCCSACLAGLLLDKIACIVAGAGCCVYAARHYAVSWNDTTPCIPLNSYARALQNGVRLIFCLKKPDM